MDAGSSTGLFLGLNSEKKSKVIFYINILNQIVISNVTIEHMGTQVNIIQLWIISTALSSKWKENQWLIREGH